MGLVMKITHKLWLGFFIIALLPLLIISVVGIRLQHKIITSLSIVDAIDIAKTIEQSISVELGGSTLHGNGEKLQKYVENLSQTTERDIIVLNRNEIILADIASEADEVGKEFVHDTGNEIKETMQDGKPRVFKEVSEDVPQGVDLVVVPLYHRPQSGDEHPKQEIIGAVIISYELTNLTGLKFTLLFTAVFVIILVIISGLSLARSIYEPITALKVAVHKVGSGILDTQIKIDSNDEIAELAEAFNKMTYDLRRTTTSIESLDHEIVVRKIAEAKMQQLNEKLENTNRELKSFVYVASHDLSEPLRKIISFGQLLQKSLEHNLSEDDAENLGFMIEGATRMSKMIEGLLAYSRVSTQTQPRKNVDLNEIVKQLKQIELSVIIEEKQVTLNVPQELPTVEVDPVQICRLMQNLIANGIKYQLKDAKPCITITSKPAADDMTRIEITDNGIGIKQEYIGSLFVMFRRLNNQNEYKGTGIGLAVCKKIVERHGGTIGIESEFGKGSTFWFTLPLAKTVSSAPNRALSVSAG